jgi:hypothetical protein
VAFGLAKRSIHALMDGGSSSLTRQVLDAMKKNAPDYPVKRIRLRDGGSRIFVELDVEAPAELHVDDAHDVAESIEGIVKHAAGSDLFICEGMYGEPEKKDKAKEHKHMTFLEAADMAKRAQVKKMWLTHYSPSLVHPEEFMGGVRKIFPDSFAAKDGWTQDLAFEEE